MKNNKNVFLYYKADAELEPKIETIKELGRKYGYTLVENHQDAKIIASIGSDGTFLQAVRKTGFREDALYVGVNDGHVGFYTDFSTNDLSKIELGLQANVTEIMSFPTLEVSVDGMKPFQCLNELSIRSQIIKTFAIDVVIDGLYLETFRGDGMVVSTPTGSTAYNKSLKGAVVDPRLPSMQLTEISSLNNNQYRTLGSPLILSKGREMSLLIIQDGNDHPIIGADNEALSIRHSHQLHVKVSDKKINTIKYKDNLFLHKIKRNFL